VRSIQQKSHARASWAAALFFAVALALVLVIAGAARADRSSSHRRALSKQPFLAFVRYGRPGGLYVVRPDGTDGRRLGPACPCTDRPQWSPTGTRLAYVYGRQLSVVGVGRPRPRVLAKSPRRGGFNGGPAWSPAGGDVAFDNFVPNRTAGIYLVRPDGSKLRRLTARMSLQEGEPQWSPSGRLIAFSANVFGHRGGIFVMTPKGKDRRRLTSFGGEPAWSPNGRILAFVRSTPNGQSIYTVRADGTHLRVLVGPGRLGTDGPIPPFSLSWSPDSGTLAWHHLSDRRCEIVRVQADGSDLTQIATPTPETCDAYPQWSRDGTLIAFGETPLDRAATPSDGIYVMKPDGTGRQLVPGTRGGDAPAWQPTAP
jgi:Tol biopolymer transport system component